jgi:hypothetical protein
LTPYAPFWERSTQLKLPFAEEESWAKQWVEDRTRPRIFVQNSTQKATNWWRGKRRDSDRLRCEPDCSTAQAPTHLHQVPAKPELSPSKDHCKELL